MAKIKRDPKKVALAQAILDAYQPKSAEEMNDALKDLFGPMFEAMLKGELNHHLGYESNDKSQKKDDNRRNGYGKKQINKTSSFKPFYHVLYLKCIRNMNLFCTYQMERKPYGKR